MTNLGTLDVDRLLESPIHRIPADFEWASSGFSARKPPRHGILQDMELVAFPSSSIQDSTRTQSTTVSYLILPSGSYL